MAKVSRPACSDLAAAGFDRQRAREEVWEALLSAGAFIAGDFTFASGRKASLKINAEVLYEKPRQYAVVLGHVATFPCIEEADVLLYVPNGMRQLTTRLGQELDKPVAHSKRVAGSKSRYDFQFASDEDRALALGATRVRILEDVVSTLGSVAGMGRLLEPERQEIHSLAYLRRGTVNPVYREGLTDHYLMEREVPLDMNEFKEQLNIREEALYYSAQSNA